MTQPGDSGMGEEALGERAFRRLLLALALLGALLRLVHLDSTLGYDEAETVKRFVEGGLPTIFAVHGGYGSTNNHLLNSLLSFALVQAFGLHVWTLRLTSFVFGVLAVPLVGIVGRGLTRDRLTGAVATFFAALSPMLVSYAPACRGYGLLLFFALSSTWLVLRIVEHDERRKLPLLALALFAGGWSHMSGLVFGATCGLFVIVQLVAQRRAGDSPAAAAHRRSAWLALGSAALAGVALVLWYSRGSLILQDVESRLVHGTFVDPSLSGLKSVHKEEALLPWIAHSGRKFFGTGSLFLPVGLSLAALGLARALWTDRLHGTLLACALLFPPLAFLAGQLKPYPRYFLFVQPFLLIALAVAVVWIARVAAARTIRGATRGPRATLAAVWVAALVVQVPALPLLRRNLQGPGANVMGIEWNVAAAVEQVASELRPGDVVLSFLQPSVRGDWLEWAFEQSASFHESLRLEPLLARPSSDAAGPRSVWYLTPERSLEGLARFPSGFEPELVGRHQRCFVYRGTLQLEALRPVPVSPFDAERRTLGPWRLEDPFSNVSASVDGPGEGPIERVSMTVGHAGGDARVVSPPIPVGDERLVELRTAVSAEQSGGIRPCGVVTLTFLDAAGEPLARVSRTALPWEGLHPRSDWTDLRLTTLAPRGTQALTITLSLAPANPAGSVVRFRPPTLFEAAVAR